MSWPVEKIKEWVKSGEAKKIIDGCLKKHKIRKKELDKERLLTDEDMKKRITI